MYESTFDLYANENEPTVVLTEHVWWVKTPVPRTTVIVNVNEDGYISQIYGVWFGTAISQSSGAGDFQQAFAIRMEVYEYLTEWELAVWRSIGPEDRELFATKKLDPEWGLDD